MNATFAPILVVPAVPFEEGIRFLHRETQIDIGADMAPTLWKILSYTNGYNDVTTIAELADLPEDEVSEIISELCDMELVVDSREQFLHFHRISNYPSAFNSNLTQDEVEAYTRSKRQPVKSGTVFEFKKDRNSALYPIREKRRSCRNFTEQTLTLDQIGNICHYAYSIYDHTVPSGGALYPLKIYVAIEKAQDGIGEGYYEYDSESDVLIRFSDSVDAEQLKYCYNQEEMPFGSSVQIIIAADLKRQPHKYANRGYRLTLIEVGHVAENISLYCAEQGLGACEMGGVQDEPLKDELELDADIWPIITIPIGYPAKNSIEEFNKIRYVEDNVGENHAVEGVWTNVFGKDGSFFGATTTYTDGEGNVQYAGATSPSYADAVFKATIEGYERWLSGQVRVDYFGTARQLEGAWIHPKYLAPLTREQSEKCGVTPFSEELPINWTKGISFDGVETYIPSDIVYYGQKTEGNRIYYGHSSGIAAYSNYEEAKKRALVELIERDALMRNWYTRQSPMIVGDDILSTHAKKRIQHWKKQGRELKILQMPSEYGWVFEAVIISDEYPCFVSGAAATIDFDSIDATINKALQEVEYGLLMTLRNPKDDNQCPEGVLTPTNHGEVYHARENADTLKWLYEGNIEDSFMMPKYTDYRQLMDALKIVVVDLSENDSGLTVVRVFSPELVPINFGFYSAHYTHPSLNGKVHPDSLKMPHYFA